MNNKKEILIKVSLAEASMIKKLRKYRYGDFKIIKIDGKPKRIIFEGSELIKESEGRDLEEKLDK